MSTENKPLALVMGVANQRSIAWACVESLIESGYDCIITYQSTRFQGSVEKLMEGNPSIVGALACDVAQNEIPVLFASRIPNLTNQPIDAIVHSIAYAPMVSLNEATWDDYAAAHHVSSYSLIQTCQHSKAKSVTTLSYLGAQRAVPNYHLIGSAKASLESLVRGLAVEYASDTRVNAVSAGPLKTVSARGIPEFGKLSQHVAQTAPRTISAKEVADTVAFLATKGTGITGQTIFVDGGYSSILPLRE